MCLLACSYIHVIKNQCQSFYTREKFTWRLLYSIKSEREKPLWGGEEEGGALWEEGGEGRPNSHEFKFRNMQSTIKRCNIDYKCFGTCFSHWHLKQNKRKLMEGGVVAGINLKLCTRQKKAGFLIGCTDGQRSDSVGAYKEL